MASIEELLEAVSGALKGNSAINAIVSSVISPEGTELAASVINGIAALEAKHNADKAAAVEAAKAAAVPEAEQPAGE